MGCGQQEAQRRGLRGAAGGVKASAKRAAAALAFGSLLCVAVGEAVGAPNWYVGVGAGANWMSGGHPRGWNRDTPVLSKLRLLRPEPSAVHRGLPLGLSLGPGGRIRLRIGHWPNLWPLAAGRGLCAAEEPNRLRGLYRRDLLRWHPGRPVGGNHGFRGGRSRHRFVCACRRCPSTPTWTSPMPWAT